MDHNLPGLERIPSSYSSSSLYTISTQSSSPDTLMMDDPLSCFDYLLPSPSTSTASITPTISNSNKKRKRKNSTMVIKPTRWSPPSPQQQSTSNKSQNGTIETDFKPTFYNPNEIKHRRRVSSHQYSVLEEEYRNNTKPNASKRHQLAERLDMTPRTVQIWFQNKRAKTKQQQQQAKMSPITPHSIEPPGQEIMAFDDGRLDPIYLMDTTFPAITKPGRVLQATDDAVMAPMTEGTRCDHGTLESQSSSSLSSPRCASDPFPMWLRPDPFAFLQVPPDDQQRRDSILHWMQKTPTDGTLMNIIQNDYLDFVLDQDDWMGLPL